MAENYTWEDIIINPNDTRLAGAIGREVYFDSFPLKCLNKANQNEDPRELISISSLKQSITPFNVRFEAINTVCIILKKDQPQKSYEERQAEWIKENDIKIGDKVRAIRIWTQEEAERERCAPRHDVPNDIVGSVGKIDEITGFGLRVDFGDDMWYCPYFVLEKIVEPKKKYVPFDLSKEEDRAFLRGKWVRSKNPDVFHEFAITQFVRMNNKNQDIKVKASNECTYFAEELLYDYEFLDGTPCGKEVEE